MSDARDAIEAKRSSDVDRAEKSYVANPIAQPAAFQSIKAIVREMPGFRAIRTLTTLRAASAHWPRR